MKSVNPHAWKFLAAVGLVFVVWGIQQIVSIPLNDPDHWNWLTADLESIAYFKFQARNRGFWSLANGIFFTVIAATAFRKRERWAWLVMSYLPIHIFLLTLLAYWMFFISIPLIALAGWALWVSRDQMLLAQPKQRGIGWILLLVVGLGFLYFAFDNFFIVPALDPNDPDRGWGWLTTNPEVIDYIKFHFRFFGIRVFGFAMLTLLTAATGLRSGSRAAWVALWIAPILVGIHIFLWPWTAPILIGVILFAGVGLWLSYPITKEQAYE